MSEQPSRDTQHSNGNIKGGYWEIRCEFSKTDGIWLDTRRVKTNLSVGISTKEKSSGKCRKLKGKKWGRRFVATDAGLYPDSRGFKNTLIMVLHSHPALPITHVEASSNVPRVLLCSIYLHLVLRVWMNLNSCQWLTYTISQKFAHTYTKFLLLTFFTFYSNSKIIKNKQIKKQNYLKLC